MKLFDWDIFHDSKILEMNFANLFESISIIFFCPLSDGVGGMGGCFKIVFKHLLHFGFELSYPHRYFFPDVLPSVHNVVFETDSREARIWKNRMEELSEPDQFDPCGKKKKINEDLYHFSMVTSSFNGIAVMPEGGGFQVICQDYEVIDVTYERNDLTALFWPPIIDWEK